MEQRSINIHIFGRQFPIRATDQEIALIKEAANAINSKIRSFRADYSHQDDLDIALMTCLDIMTEQLRLKAHHAQDASLALASVERLDQELAHALRVADSSS